MEGGDGEGAVLQFERMCRALGGKMGITVLPGVGGAEHRRVGTAGPFPSVSVLSVAPLPV